MSRPLNVIHCIAMIDIVISIAEVDGYGQKNKCAEGPEEPGPALRGSVLQRQPVRDRAGRSADGSGGPSLAARRVGQVQGAPLWTPGSHWEGPTIPSAFTPSSCPKATTPAATVTIALVPVQCLTIFKCPSLPRPAERSVWKPPRRLT